jgi:hypothetical protein
MTAPPAPVVPQAPVTILDVYTKQVELGAQLLVIHEQLKAIPDHETRIRRLEEAKSRIYGAAAAISVIVSAAGTWIGFMLSHH